MIIISYIHSQLTFNHSCHYHQHYCSKHCHHHLHQPHFNHHRLQFIVKKKQRQKQQHTTFYKSSLTLRITALNNSGDLLQTAPTINPPALVPRAAVNCGLEYPKLCSALAQASKSCKAKYLSFSDKIL